MFAGAVIDEEGLTTLITTELTLNVGTWNIPNVTNMSNMFFNVNKLTLNVTTWNMPVVTNMTKMFFNVNNLSIDMGKWNMPKVTNMYGMFMWNNHQIQSKFEIKGLANLNISKVTDMSSMFNKSNVYNCCHIFKSFSTITKTNRNCATNIKW